jgi:hypothetical protein
MFHALRIHENKHLSDILVGLWALSLQSYPQCMNRGVVRLHDIAVDTTWSMAFGLSERSLRAMSLQSL